MHLSSANPRQKRDNDLSVHEERRRVKGGGRWQHPGKRRLRGGGRELEAVRGQGLPGCVCGIILGAVVLMGQLLPVFFPGDDES